MPACHHSVHPVRLDSLPFPATLAHPFSFQGKATDINAAEPLLLIARSSKLPGNFLLNLNRLVPFLHTGNIYHRLAQLALERAIISNSRAGGKGLTRRYSTA